MTKIPPGNPENRECTCGPLFSATSVLEDKTFREVFLLENVSYRKHDSASADTYGTAVCRFCGRQIQVVQYFMENLWNKA